MPWIGTDGTVLTFGFRKRTLIGFWKVRTLLDNDIDGIQNAHFIQLQWKFQPYKMDIFCLSEISWWNCGGSPLKAMCFCTLESQLVAASKPTSGFCKSGRSVDLEAGFRRTSARFRSKLRMNIIVRCTYGYFRNNEE